MTVKNKKESALTCEKCGSLVLCKVSTDAGVAVDVVCFTHTCTECGAEKKDEESHPTECQSEWTCAMCGREIHW